jgi:hypothetical protein
VKVAGELELIAAMKEKRKGPPFLLEGIEVCALLDLQVVQSLLRFLFYGTMSAYARNY